MSVDIASITARIRKHKKELEKRYSVSEIGIFGSCVRGEDSDASDLDILVSTNSTLDLFDFLELEELLSDISGKQVDLVSRKALKPEIGKQILKEVVFL